MLDGVRSPWVGVVMVALGASSCRPQVFVDQLTPERFALLGFERTTLERFQGDVPSPCALVWSTGMLTRSEASAIIPPDLTVFMVVVEGSPVSLRADSR